MIRLWPRSLFGRLVTILIVGLLLAQVASVIIHWRDRGHAVHRVGGIQFAYRIIEIVNWLDPLPADEQREAARRMSSRRLRVAIETPFDPGAASGDDPAVAKLLRSMLQRNLGEDRPLAVHVSHIPFASARGPAPGWRGRGDDLFFLTKVALRNGAGAVFRFRLPRESLGGLRRLLFSIGVLVTSVIVIALIAVRQATQPLSMLARAATELGRDINRPPLAEDRGPLEVRQAATAFNRMQDRIKRFLEDRTRMLAAVSHDLKTPITRLRIRAEMLDDETTRDKIIHDLEEMEAMVSETLEFMRGIDSQEPVQAVDLKSLLESIEEDARKQQQVVSLDLRDIPPYRGRPLALKRSLTNLVGNALKYGDRARVSLREHGSDVVIEITDRGPGIPKAQLERVFDPFYRVEASRSRDTGGTGMGLAIARNIARAHGGDISLANRPGGGLVAALRLPRHADPGQR